MNLHQNHIQDKSEFRENCIQAVHTNTSTNILQLQAWFLES